MKKYLIGDLELATGIKAHTIRMWEKRYPNLIQPERSETNIRYYTEKTFKKFLLISLLYHNGLKISEIAKLKDDEIREKSLLLYRESEEYYDELSKSDELLNAVFDFNDQAFNDLLTDIFLAYDLTKALSLIIFPFLRKVDILWKSDVITKLRKIFVFNLVDEFFDRILFAVRKSVLSGKRRYLIAGASDDLEVMTLKIVRLILRRKGVEAYFFAEMPLEDALQIDKQGLNYVSVVTVASPNKKQNVQLLNYCSKLTDRYFYIIDPYYMIPSEMNNMQLINALQEINEVEFL